MSMIFTAEMFEGWRRAIELARIHVEIAIAFDSYWKDNNG